MDLLTAAPYIPGGSDDIFMAPYHTKSEEVLERILEIRSYYDACENLFGNSAKISKAMLAYSLGCSRNSDVDPVLSQLVEQGKVLAVQGDVIFFSPNSRA